MTDTWTTLFEWSFSADNYTKTKHHKMLRWTKHGAPGYREKHKYGISIKRCIKCQNAAHNAFFACESLTGQPSFPYYETYSKLESASFNYLALSIPLILFNDISVCSFSVWYLFWLEFLFHTSLSASSVIILQKNFNNMEMTGRRQECILAKELQNNSMRCCVKHHGWMLTSVRNRK